MVDVISRPMRAASASPSLGYPPKGGQTTWPAPKGARPSGLFTLYHTLFRVITFRRSGYALSLTSTYPLTLLYYKTFLTACLRHAVPFSYLKHQYLS
jgi:hypothetical protein